MHTALSWSPRLLIASFYRPMSLLLFSDQFFPVMFLTGHTLCSTLPPPHFHYILGRTMNADSKFTQWQQRAEHTENWHQVHLDDRESCRVTQKRSNIGWVWWTNRQWGGGQCLWAHRGTYSNLEWEKSLGTFPPKEPQSFFGLWLSAFPPWPEIQGDYTNQTDDSVSYIEVQTHSALIKFLLSL